MKIAQSSEFLTAHWRTKSSGWVNKKNCLISDLLASHQVTICSEPDLKLNSIPVAIAYHISVKNTFVSHIEKDRNFKTQGFFLFSVPLCCSLVPGMSWNRSLVHSLSYVLSVWLSCCPSCIHCWERWQSLKNPRAVSDDNEPTAGSSQGREP